MKVQSSIQYYPPRTSVKEQEKKTQNPVSLSADEQRKNLLSQLKKQRWESLSFHQFTELGRGACHHACECAEYDGCPAGDLQGNDGIGGLEDGAAARGGKTEE